MIRTLAIFFFFTFLFTSFVSAQIKRIYRQHEVIDAGNGLKIEVLQCRGEGENAECDIIYYTEKRQQGKRQWEKLSRITEQEQLARKGLTPKTAPVTKPTPPTTNEKQQHITVTDTANSAPPIAAKPPGKITYDSASKNKGIVKSAVPASPVANTYTLQQCFLLALEKNTTLKRAENNITQSTIDLTSAKYNLLPSLSYEFGHYFSFGKNIDPVTNTFVNENFSGGYSAVGLQLDLFSGFNRLNTIKQSSYQIEAAAYAKKRIELELLTNVTLTYARLLLNNDQLMIARSNILSTSKQLDVINEKIKVGRLTKYEAYAFDARYNTENANLITIQNDSAAASADLKHLLNLPYKQQVSISPVDTTTLSNIYTTNISITDFIDTILLNHPAIKQAKMEEQVAQAGLKIARSNLYPVLSVGGNFVTNYNVDQVNTSGQKIPLGQQLSDNVGKNINISLHVPIFSRMQNANLIKKQKISISNAQLNIQDAENLIVTNTLQLINDFNSSRQKYMATSLAYNQNLLSYSMYEEKYRLGQISSFEMFTARDLLNTAASQYAQAKLELFFRYQLLQLLKF